MRSYKHALTDTYVQSRNGTCNNSFSNAPDSRNGRCRGSSPTQSCSVLTGCRRRAMISLIPPGASSLSPRSLISRPFSGPARDSSASAQCSDSASAKVKCFYCSHASLSLTSSCSALPSLQNRVPWDPSAPLLDGTSDTSGKQERIKSPRVYKCIWKLSVEGWRNATNPRWHTGNICPESKKKKKKGLRRRCHWQNLPTSLTEDNRKSRRVSFSEWAGQFCCSPLR